MQSQELVFQLSESGEQIVRTYECTKLRRWFLPETIGYLTVTNRRVVFHSSGKSLTGKSLLISEMPIEDVAGIIAYEGLSINGFMFLILSVLAFVGTQVVAGVLPAFLTGYIFAILLMMPFVALRLLTSNIVSDMLREQVVQFFDRISQGKLQLNRDLRVYLPYTRIPLYVGLVILIWRISAEDILGFAGSMTGSLILIIAYAFVFFLLFGRQQSFSLAIGSKTKKDTGIYIPGDSFRLFSRGDLTALEALSARPAADASRVTRELGAMLMDIQQLGDLGVQKWLGKF